MKIYTRTGDTGDTGLRGGARVPKDSAVPEASGTVDELNSSLGWVRAIGLPDDVDRVVQRVQHELFLVGAGLATQRPNNSTEKVSDEHVAWLEQQIDWADEQLDPLDGFVVPGGTPAGAAMHVARTVCRRAERRIVSLARAAHVPDAVLCYMNRLSDLLFVLARLTNERGGRPEERRTP